MKETLSFYAMENISTSGNIFYDFICTYLTSLLFHTVESVKFHIIFLFDEFTSSGFRSVYYQRVSKYRTVGKMQSMGCSSPNIGQSDTGRVSLSLIMALY